MKFKRLLVGLALILTACRLPYELGRRLSPGASTGTPVVFLPGVSAGEAPTGTPAVFLPEVSAGDAPTAAYPGAPVSTSSASPGVSPTPADALSGAYPTQSTDPFVSPEGGATAFAETPAAPGLPATTPFRIPTATTTTTPTATRTPLPLPPWSRAPLKSSDPAGFERASGGVQLVEFFAYWSGPSQAMAPIVQGVAEEYAGRVNFVFLDIDNPAVEPIANELGFDAAPHFFLLDAGGRILEEWSGYVAVVDLRAALDAALNR